jgi:hypothetical protein
MTEPGEIPDRWIEELVNLARLGVALQVRETGQLVDLEPLRRAWRVDHQPAGACAVPCG